MKAPIFFLFLILTMHAGAQQIISGRITDKKGDPIPFANIYIEGSYDGTTSDEEGQYEFSFYPSGHQTLVASFIGYQKYTCELRPDQADSLIHIVLTEQVSELKEVAVTAGVFTASDKKKSATMSSFDIASTPSAMGDIYGAYATMPGSQKVGEEGMLFVRGGEAYETKTYMDGMLVQSPYFSKAPDIPTRGRFSPLLFSETTFSTGGYSAEFGQALSSVVELKTNGLEPEDKTTLSIMTVGASASTIKRWENSSLALTGMYVNNALHNRLFMQHVEWVKNPELADGTLMYRKKTGESGMIRVFCSYNVNSMHMKYDNFEQGTLDDIRMVNHGLFANTTYIGQLNEKWLVKSGLAFNQDFEDMFYNETPVHNTNQASQAKLVLTHLSSDHMKIRMGSDVLYSRYRQQIVTDNTFLLQVNDVQPSMFIESELKISSKFAIRIGARAEYSSILEKTSITPRFAAAYKTGSHSQVSLAYGKFNQKPENDYLKIAPWLSAEKSDHYILNFQYKKNRRQFRAEAYLKQYDNLVKYSDLYSNDPNNFNNNGFGQAYGLDLFWRDRETFRNVDYWISYSYLNTERDYRDYPLAVKPGYTSAHNLSLVYKHYIIPLKTFVGLTYSFASGRPYNDKNSQVYMDGRTGPYNDISLNITYITQLFKNDAIIHLNITNLMGFKNIYGYTYSDTILEDGLFASQPIISNTGRQAVLVLLISF
jgi:hypothetical protein